MKKRILEAVIYLRQGRPLSVDHRNSNRYRIVSFENDGSRTGYYFSTPIYNIKSGKLIDCAFHQKGEAAFSVGSNANITVADNVSIENADGHCSVSINGKASSMSDYCVRTSVETISPTANGVVYTVKCSEASPYHLTFAVNRPFLQIRENGKYFALMSEEFKPFVTVSCIGTVNAEGNIIAPAGIAHQKVNERTYELSIYPMYPSEQYVMFEINLYEPKLLQDTTVESANPGLNNAFGGVAFIGDTKACGEQWLYTRPDFTKMSEILDHQIKKAVLHLPKLSTAFVPISGYGVSVRFCSFGSTWDNKIPLSAHESNTYDGGDYADLDITHLLKEEGTGFIKRSEGLILRAEAKDSGFSAIATGDSFYAPQVLEINFR